MDHAGKPGKLFAGTSGDTLAGQKFTSGLRVYDLAKPEAPREIAFLPLGGLGPHRIWYVGERYAYVSVHLPEFSDHILVIVDMKEPTRPEVAGKFWLPGMWTGGGETPSWPKGRRYALHHALVAGNLAFSAWRDGGLAIVDVGDPAKPKMVSYRNWDPPFGGGTHSPLPLLDRNLLVVADEANFADCSKGFRYIWVFDVREPSNPVSISTMPIPDEADYCRRVAISDRIICGRTDPAPSSARATFSPRCTMPACAPTTSKIRFSRARSVISYRPIQPACSIRGRTGRR